MYNNMYSTLMYKGNEPPRGNCVGNTKGINLGSGAHVLYSKSIINHIHAHALYVHTSNLTVPGGSVLILTA